MGKYDDLQVRITKHALGQYHDRVEWIEWAELQQLCEQQIRDRDISYDARGWFHLAGVWWVYEMQDRTMIFITCYGRTNMDMPRAIAWAARHHDRINLSH